MAVSLNLPYQRRKGRLDRVANRRFLWSFRYDQFDLRTDKTSSNFAAFSLWKQRGQSRTLSELLKKTVEMRSAEAKGTRCCFDFEDSQAGFCRQLSNHLASLQGSITRCC
jgi:hypothetical protein